MSPIFCECGKTITPRPEWAGKQIRCSCGTSLHVPFPAPVEVEVVHEETTKRCPSCAETIQAAAIKCRFCNHRLDRPGVSRTGVDTGGQGAMVMGILGWAVCGLLHPIAWAMGAGYEAECRSRGVEPSSAGKAGRILGLIGTIFLGGSILLFIVMMLAG